MSEHDPSTPLPENVQALLRAPSPCFVTTLMPDGSPQVSQVWVETDGTHVVINTVEGFQKTRNVARDPRVAVAVSDAERPYRYAALRGRVVDATTDGAADHIERLAQKYLGGPYPGYGGGPQTRVTMTIAVDSIHTIG